MPEPGAGGPLDPPIFGRSVNPIPSWEDRLSPPITTTPPQCFSPSGITEYYTLCPKSSTTYLNAVRSKYILHMNISKQLLCT